MYLFDTNVLVDFLRGKLPIGRAYLSHQDPDDFKIPAIVAAELNFGAKHSDNTARALAQTSKLLALFDIVPFDTRCAEVYGTIRQELQASGQAIEANDLLIAATALAHDAVLITNNVKHFKRVRGLQVESWEELVL